MGKNHGFAKRANLGHKRALIGRDKQSCEQGVCLCSVTSVFFPCSRLIQEIAPDAPCVWGIFILGERALLKRLDLELKRSFRLRLSAHKQSSSSFSSPAEVV